MNPDMVKRLTQVEKRYKEVEATLSDSGASYDRDAMTRLGKEYRSIREVMTLWNEHKQTETALLDVQGLIVNESDTDMLELARQEEAHLTCLVKSLEQKIIDVLTPKDAVDEADAIVEIRSGTGGEEAGLFAAELFRMYSRYAERKGWKITLLSSNETGLGGIKEVIFQVTGDGAYRLLHLESGVHRVQRVPTTESQGRLHTSAATVAVLPRAEEVEVHIDESDLRTDIFHSSGAGGQNVNKVATAVRLIHIPTGLVVVCQNERSQLQNKIKAMEVLRSRLWDLEIRKRQEETAADRKSQVGGGDRSEKIRTYNFPQNRITDHRVKLTSHSLDRAMDGDIDEFVDALQVEEQARKMAQIEEL